MPADNPTDSGRLTIQELKGLNEREQHANNDLGFFDVLKGCVPTTKNTLTRANGSRLHLTFDSPVMSICQTNDSRRNVIVQTKAHVYVVSENELFGVSEPATNLVPLASTEEENMSQAIIVHQANFGVNGGSYTTANVWQQAGLTNILSQVNPDGTAAAFVTLASNQLTLAAGKYRLRGYSLMSGTAGANSRLAARIQNITAGAPLWNGLGNETSNVLTIDTTGGNYRLEVGGYIDLAVPTIIEIQGLGTAAVATSGFGAAMSRGSAPLFTLPRELYRYLEILKTA